MKPNRQWGIILIGILPAYTYTMFSRGKAKQAPTDDRETQTILSGKCFSQGDAQALADTREAAVFELYKKEAAIYKERVRADIAQLVEEKKQLEQKLSQCQQELMEKQALHMQEKCTLQRNQALLSQEITNLTNQITTLSQEKAKLESTLQILTQALEETQKTEALMKTADLTSETGNTALATAFIAGAATGATATFVGKRLSHECTQQ